MIYEKWNIPKSEKGEIEEKVKCGKKRWNMPLSYFTVSGLAMKKKKKWDGTGRVKAEMKKGWGDVILGEEGLYLTSEYRIEENLWNLYYLKA